MKQIMLTALGLLAWTLVLLGAAGFGATAVQSARAGPDLYFTVPLTAASLFFGFVFFAIGAWLLRDMEDR